MSTRLGTKELISERLGWHFGAIGVVNFEGCQTEQIYKFILGKAFIHASSKAIQHVAPQMLLNASLKFFAVYNDAVKPSPASFLFKINQRHLIFLLKGMLDVPNNYFQMIDNVALLWVNEICRTVLDRHTDPFEHDKFYKIVCSIAAEVFMIRPKVLPPDFHAN